MKSKRNITGILVLFAIVLLILCSTGLIGLWLNGIAYIAYDPEKFTDTNGHVIPGEYSVSIDLDDLPSNIGKELYNDGTNKIYVNWIEYNSSSNNGGYEIRFRSCGQYSLTDAALVSGVHHVTEGEYSYTINMSAKMTAKYNDELYISREAGTSALNHRDGDDFLFYIFPAEAYQSGKISLNEKGKVLLTVTNLYKNIWIKNFST